MLKRKVIELCISIRAWDNMVIKTPTSPPIFRLIALGHYKYFLFLISNFVYNSFLIDLVALTRAVFILDFFGVFFSLGIVFKDMFWGFLYRVVPPSIFECNVYARNGHSTRMKLPLFACTWLLPGRYDNPPRFWNLYCSPWDSQLHEINCMEVLTEQVLYDYLYIDPANNFYRV